MKKLLLAFFVTFVSLSVLAKSDEMAVHTLDTDKDGLISMDEAKIDSTLSAIFSELDLNQDGYLSHLELKVKTEKTPIQS
jgi:Ca2+-binding EF-hand superfamily protein